MPIDPELLEILVCPETHQPVKPADNTLLESVNARIKAGALKNHQGEAVSKRSGTSIIIRQTTHPPSELPTTCARSMPRRSSNATASSDQSPAPRVASTFLSSSASPNPR